MKSSYAILLVLVVAVGAYLVLFDGQPQIITDSNSSHDFEDSLVNSSLSTETNVEESPPTDITEDPQTDSTDEVEWLYPKDFRDQPAWGIRNGIIVGIYPADLGGIGGGTGGPKGLFRIHKDGPKGLAWVNFLSVEPETLNGRSLSEYEETAYIPINYTARLQPENIGYQGKIDYRKAATITKHDEYDQLNREHEEQIIY